MASEHAGIDARRDLVLRLMKNSVFPRSISANRCERGRKYGTGVFRPTVPVFCDGTACGGWNAGGCSKKYATKSERHEAVEQGKRTEHRF